MGGSGLGREVTRGTTEATLRTSSQWELSRDLGKLSETSPADVDAALNPGEIYREPRETKETPTKTKETAEPTTKPEQERLSLDRQDDECTNESKETSTNNSENNSRYPRTLPEKTERRQIERYKDSAHTQSKAPRAQKSSNINTDKEKDSRLLLDHQETTSDPAQRTKEDKTSQCTQREKEKHRIRTGNRKAISDRLSRRTNVGTPEPYRKTTHRASQR